MKILNEELDENRIDSHYKALKCDLLTLDKTHEDFEVTRCLFKFYARRAQSLVIHQLISEKLKVFR